MGLSLLKPICGELRQESPQLFIRYQLNLFEKVSNGKFRTAIYSGLLNMILAIMIQMASLAKAFQIVV